MYDPEPGIRVAVTPAVGHCPGPGLIRLPIGIVGSGTPDSCPAGGGVGGVVGAGEAGAVGPPRGPGPVPAGAEGAEAVSRLVEGVEETEQPRYLASASDSGPYGDHQAWLRQVIRVNHGPGGGIGVFWQLPTLWDSVFGIVVRAINCCRISADTPMTPDGSLSLSTTTVWHDFKNCCCGISSERS